MPTDGVSVHAALIVATKQTFQIEFHKVGFFLRGSQKHSLNRLLPTHHPGIEGVLHKLKGLLLNIGKARLFQITDHVRRYSENSSNLVDLELSGFQELRLFRGNGNGGVLHALLQNSHLIGVAATAKSGLPAFPDTLGIFDGAGMLQDTTGCCTVGEELGSVLLTGDGHANSVFGHCNGAVANKTVKTQTRDVQDIRRRQTHYRAVHSGSFVRAGGVFVVQLPLAVSVHSHAIRHQRIQCDDLALAVANDL